jgi:hypothetical protein
VHDGIGETFKGEKGMCTLVDEGNAHELKVVKTGFVAYKLVKWNKITDKMYPLYKHFSKMLPYKLNVKYNAQYYTKVHCPIQTVSLATPHGFHAYYSYKDALLARKDLRSLGWASTVFSIVRVRLFGNAVWYENGLRAQQMIIESVVCGRRPKKMEK